MNFYPFHIGDYISHTSHLSDAEDLAYRRMIDLYYMNEKPFPNDVHWIAKRVKSTPEIVAELLTEYFEYSEKDDSFHNSRADKEIAKYQFVKESGKKGAEKRWGNKDIKPLELVPNSPPIATPLATKTITKTNTNKKHTPIGFDLFWDAYDKKVGKPNSLKAWAKIDFEKVLLQVVVEKAKADRKAKPDNKYRKDPERWLKGQHWLDEVVIEQAPEEKLLPLGTNEQIEYAYRTECGGDPSRARFGSYQEMRKFVQDFRDKKLKNGQI